MAVARIAIATLGSFNAVLVYNLVKRHSRQWGIFAGLMYAVWRVPAVTEHTVLLEPLLTFFLLSSLLLLTGVDNPAGGGRYAGSGFFLGLALATKLWVGPVAVFLLFFVLMKRGFRSGCVFAAGLAGSLAILWLPFAILSSRNFARQIFFDQLGRSGPDGFMDRLLRFAEIGGYGVITAVGNVLPPLAIASCVVVFATIACLAAWALIWPRLYIGLLLVQIAEIMAAPVFYYHYFAFPAAMIAVVVAAAGERLSKYSRGTRATSIVASAIMLVALAVMAAYRPTPPYRDFGPLRRLAAQHTCVWFERASHAVASDALSRQLDRECAMTVDPYAVLMDSGIAVAYDSDTVRREDIATQRRIGTELRRSDAAVTQNNLEQSVLNEENARMLREQFVAIYHDNSLTFWSRI
jgi:hypothetical protein